jgi:DNA-binding CsgD family transcriptional regulator
MRAPVADPPASRSQSRPDRAVPAVLVASWRGGAGADDGRAFSTLVSDIYDAAVDPARWSGVLTAIGDFVGGQAGGIVSKDAISRDGTPNHHFGVDPHFVQLYAATHARFDPLAGLPCFAVEQVVSVPELVPYDEFRRGRFFHEWMRPQGYVDAASAVLEKSAVSCSLLTVIRSGASGVVDDEMRDRMRRIVPHLRRAVGINRVIAAKAAEAATFADTLDGLCAGMFLVDATGRLVHANACGQAMLGEGAVVRRAGDRLAATAASAALLLGQALAAAADGDGAVGLKGIAVPLVGRDGSCYAAHVLPLTTGARRRAGAAYAAVAAVFVRKAELDAPSPPEAIARHYGLTPTELRVLIAIVQVGGVPETADALGIGEATVRTHLHRLFAKTGAVRQADLVKLVAGFANPLVN